MPDSEGFHEESSVSPLHFWFFVSCIYVGPPHRPISPLLPDELFRHPLFLMPTYSGPPPLVVPEYFLKHNAVFDGLNDLGSTSYYLFPYFAQRLFEYVDEPATRPYPESFIDHYLGREVPWFIPAGTDVARLPFNAPHELLRLRWRWEEVLTDMYNWRQVGKGPQPYVCRLATKCSDDRRIVAYFTCFARMAKIWRSNQIGSGV